MVINLCPQCIRCSLFETLRPSLFTTPESPLRIFSIARSCPPVMFAAAQIASAICITLRRRRPLHIKLGIHSRPMPDISNTAVVPAARTIGSPTWWALVALLSLIAIAVALIVTAVIPDVNGHVAAAAVGVVVLLGAATVSIVLARIDSPDLATSRNDRARR